MQLMAEKREEIMQIIAHRHRHRHRQDNSEKRVHMVIRARK